MSSQRWVVSVLSADESRSVLIFFTANTRHVVSKPGIPRGDPSHRLADDIGLN